MLRLQTLACLVLFVMMTGAGAFICTPTLVQRNKHIINRPAAIAAAAFNNVANKGSCSGSCAGRGRVSMQAAPSEGAHGMRSRFLPIEQLDDQAFAPRIVQVAGALREISVADVMAVGTSQPAEIGMWQYDFSDPHGPQMGTVAVPGCEAIFNMEEPVAIVSPNDDLNIILPEDEEAEVLLIVDRVDRNFVNSKFFLWNTADGLEVRFFESEPPLGYECVGRVGLVVVPFVKTMAQTFTGFEEEEF